MLTQLKLRYCLSLIIIVVLVLGLASCGDSDSPTEPTPTVHFLASATIDASGGIIEHEEVSLVVPAGAFTTAREISLLRVEVDLPEMGLGNAYRVDGLPQAWNESWDLKFPDPTLLDKTDPALPLFMIREEAFVSSLGEMAVGYIPLIPVAEDGFWLISLPAVEGDGNADSGNKDESTSLTVVRGGIASYTVSNGGHFRLHWAPGQVALDDIALAAGYLEEAYDYYLSLGFEYTAREFWPVSVAVIPLDGTVFGFYTPTKLGTNSGNIQLNATKLSDHAEVRTTAGHEFFHLVQYLYDGRSAWARGTQFPLHHWLNEATASWAESNFSDLENYVSPTLAGNEVAPFVGLEAGRIGSPKDHGYGLSGVINYLVQENGTDFLQQIYNAVGEQPTGTGVLGQTVGDVSGWWNDFLLKYVQGEIYPLNGAAFSSLRVATYTLIEGGDLNWSTTLNTPDLAGKLIQIKLNDPDISESANLDLTVSGGGISKVHAFSYYPTDPLVWLGSADDLLNIQGLKSLTDANRGIMVLIVNNRAVPDYLESTPLSLSVEVHPFLYDPDEYHQCIIDWKFLINKQYGDGSTGQEEVYLSNFIADNLVFDGTSFSCSIDKYLQWGSDVKHYYGLAAGTLSDDLSQVLDYSFDLTYDLIHEDDTVEHIYTTSASAEDLPFIDFGYNSMVTYRLDGASACAAVTEFGYQNMYNDWTSTGYTCGAENYLYLRFQK